MEARTALLDSIRETLTGPNQDKSDNIGHVDTAMGTVTSSERRSAMASLLLLSCDGSAASASAIVHARLVYPLVRIILALPPRIAGDRNVSQAVSGTTGAKPEVCARAAEVVAGARVAKEAKSSVSPWIESGLLRGAAIMVLANLARHPATCRSVVTQGATPALLACGLGLVGQLTHASLGFVPGCQVLAKRRSLDGSWSNGLYKALVLEVQKSFEPRVNDADALSDVEERARTPVALVAPDPDILAHNDSTDIKNKGTATQHAISIGQKQREELIRIVPVCAQASEKVDSAYKAVEEGLATIAELREQLKHRTAEWEEIDAKLQFAVEDEDFSVAAALKPPVAKANRAKKEAAQALRMAKRKQRSTQRERKRAEAYLARALHVAARSRAAVLKRRQRRNARRAARARALRQQQRCHNRSLLCPPAPSGRRDYRLLFFDGEQQDHVPLHHMRIATDNVSGFDGHADGGARLHTVSGGLRGSELLSEQSVARVLMGEPVRATLMPSELNVSGTAAQGNYAASNTSSRQGHAMLVTSGLPFKQRPARPVHWDETEVKHAAAVVGGACFAQRVAIGALAALLGTRICVPNTDTDLEAEDEESAENDLCSLMLPYSTAERRIVVASGALELLLALSAPLRRAGVTSLTPAPKNTSLFEFARGGGGGSSSDDSEGPDGCDINVGEIDDFQGLRCDIPSGSASSDSAQDSDCAEGEAASAPVCSANSNSSGMGNTTEESDICTGKDHEEGSDIGSRVIQRVDVDNVAEDKAGAETVTRVNESSTGDVGKIVYAVQGEQPNKHQVKDDDEIVPTKSNCLKAGTNEEAEMLNGDDTSPVDTSKGRSRYASVEVTGKDKIEAQDIDQSYAKMIPKGRHSPQSRIQHQVEASRKPKPADFAINSSTPLDVLEWLATPLPHDFDAAQKEGLSGLASGTLASLPHNVLVADLRLMRSSRSARAAWLADAHARAEADAKGVSWNVPAPPLDFVSGAGVLHEAGISMDGILRPGGILWRRCAAGELQLERLMTQRRCASAKASNDLAQAHSDVASSSVALRERLDAAHRIADGTWGHRRRARDDTRAQVEELRCRANYLRDRATNIALGFEEDDTEAAIGRAVLAGGADLAKWRVANPSASECQRNEAESAIIMRRREEAQCAADDALRAAKEAASAAQAAQYFVEMLINPPESELQRQQRLKNERANARKAAVQRVVNRNRYEEEKRKQFRNEKLLADEIEIKHAELMLGHTERNTSVVQIAEAEQMAIVNREQAEIAALQRARVACAEADRQQQEQVLMAGENELAIRIRFHEAAAERAKEEAVKQRKQTDKAARAAKRKERQRLRAQKAAKAEEAARAKDEAELREQELVLRREAAREQKVLMEARLKAMKEKSRLQKTPKRPPDVLRFVPKEERVTTPMYVERDDGSGGTMLEHNVTGERWFVRNNADGSISYESARTGELCREKPSIQHANETGDADAMAGGKALTDENSDAQLEPACDAKFTDERRQQQQQQKEEEEETEAGAFKEKERLQEMHEKQHQELEPEREENAKAGTQDLQEKIKLRMQLLNPKQEDMQGQQQQKLRSENDDDR